VQQDLEEGQGVEVGKKVCGTGN